MAAFNHNPYNAYYLAQAGGSLHVYRGRAYQHGHGLGSFFSGLLRSALPLFKSGARAIGREVVRTGANVLGDIADNRNVKESFKARLGEAGNSLTRRAGDTLHAMAGSGLGNRFTIPRRRGGVSVMKGVSHIIRGRVKNKKKRSSGGNKRVKKTKKKKTTVARLSARDIFS